MPVVFEGTYDQLQFNVSKTRRDTLKSHLFGELLPEETLAELSEEDREKLKDAAPNFSPNNHSDTSNEVKV